MSVKDEWKPLKNLLRKTSLIDTLGVIRAYSVFRSSPGSATMPGDIQVDDIFYNNEHTLLPWELEVLCRESLAVCERQSSPPKSLKNWRDLANSVNRIKRIEEYITKEYISQETILKEVTVRLAHRQFKYQTDRPNNTNLIRYHKIYSYPDLKVLFEKVFGLSPKKLFTIGMALWANYQSNLGTYYPLEELSLKDVDSDDYDQFLSLFSIEIEAMQREIYNKHEGRFSNTFMYDYFPLYDKPLLFTTISGREAHICPLPLLLFWRITGGLYYDLVNKSDFSQAYGDSFETYVGNLLTDTFDGCDIAVYGEEQDSTQNRCDWIIDQESSFTIIECKTKRLTFGAKLELFEDEELSEQINKLAEAVVQAYKTLVAYKENSYKRRAYSFDKNKQPLICVVTLENWYLMGDQLLALREKVNSMLNEQGFDGGKMQDECPFLVCSIADFELLAFLAKTNDMFEMLKPYFTEDMYSRWEVSNYLRDRMQKEVDEYKYIYLNELRDVFTVALGS